MTLKNKYFENAVNNENKHEEPLHIFENTYINGRWACDVVESHA